MLGYSTEIRMDNTTMAQAALAVLIAPNITDAEDSRACARHWVAHARECREAGDRHGCADAWQRARYSAHTARLAEATIAEVLVFGTAAEAMRYRKVNQIENDTRVVDALWTDTGAAIAATPTPRDRAAWRYLCSDHRFRVKQ